MSALLQSEAALVPMTVRDLAAVLAIENSAYSFPWTRGNFIDSLAAGYLAQMLMHATDGIVGYYLAMPGVDEMHLLNLTIAPARQRRGHSLTLLDDLERRCREARIDRIWLEVRASNERARQLYARRGFVEAGRRRGYYPAGASRREDAIVMNLVLPIEPAHAVD